MSPEVLAEQIAVARENLARIVEPFDGSQNHKEIRRLRRRVLNKLLAQRDIGFLTAQPGTTQGEAA